MSTTTIQVKVKPSARKSVLTEQADGTWRAEVKAPPVEGKANAELISLVADRFDCPKAAVTIRRGASGRTKLVTIRLP